MGIMKSWENWSQKQWNSWGKKLSPLYKQIDSMEWSPEMKEVLEKLSVLLPKTVADSLLKIVVDLYTKLGPQMAEQWLKTILKSLNNIHL